MTEEKMCLSTRASRIRKKEAQNARAIRAEIIRALSVGEISRRDLFRWGIFTTGGQFIPDCAETATFPWTIKINGQPAHLMNANRISLLIPKAGEIAHWTLVDGGGWDHPIHLPFEEGVTLDRGPNPIPVTERLVRKDGWRLRAGGSVTFQVQFGEYGGSYVNHCHNTVHEDTAMLMRLQLLTGLAGSPQAAITDTPNPSPDGVTFATPEILPEGDPRQPLRV
jgi:Multicopper oxidase